MSATDDMNSLDSVALDLEQIAVLAEALKEYDAPEMYWDEESDRSNEFRRECADEMRARLDRAVKNDGIHGCAVAFSEEEYRVSVEALVQYKRENEDERVPDLISHLQWFKAEL